MFVSVTVCVALVFTGTLPKLTDAGEGESWRTGATPVPDSTTAKEDVGELFTRERFAAKVPADEGAKLAVKDEEPPGAIVRGRVNPEKENVELVTEACVTTRLAVPGFVMLTVCVLVTPVVTLPKVTEDGTTEISG